MICKNCKYNFEGNFCNNCGQNAKVKRINFNYLVNELPNSIFQLNRGFLYTVKELFTRPGHSIREFLSGERKQHYKPVAFLIVTSTIYVLSAYLMERNTFLDDLILGWKDGVIANDPIQHDDFKYLNWISKNQAYFPLLILPFYSISTYLAFAKSKYNYFEHLVINFYITGQQMIIYFILGFIFYKENIFLTVPFFIGMVYNFWTFSQFFENKKNPSKLGLIILSYLIFAIQIVIMVFILGFLFGTFK